MKMTKLLSIFFASTLAFNISCSNNDDASDINPTLNYGNGFLISNEGNMKDKDASVTYISQDLTNKQDNIYSANNDGEILGDVLQMIGTNGNYDYLVVNNSNKIVVVDKLTFKKVAVLTNQIYQPRSIAFANGYIYVTNYDFGTTKNVTIYKTSDLSFVKKIDFTEAVDKIVEAGGNIFVQNSSYGYGNQISYITPTTNTVASVITLPNGNINKIISNNNSVYAIAYGTTDSYIYQISSTGNIVNTQTLTGITNATNLQIENGKYYFSSGNKIYSMNIGSTTTPTIPLITAVDGGQYFTLYGFNVVDGKIFASDVKGFTQASEVTVYSAATGDKIKTFTTGKATNGVIANF